MGNFEIYLDQLKRQLPLKEPEAEDLLTQIFKGERSEQEVYDVIFNLTERPATPYEIIGFARAMKAHMKKVDLGKRAIDVCGTGGSGRDRFNVSTAVAFVLASMGNPVAKHGNRGSSGPTGSFDFLEALDIPFGQLNKDLKTLYKTHNLCFLFARNHHPGMKYVSKARREYGRRTVFNLLGPICNPADVQYQIVGTTSKHYTKAYGAIQSQLGTKRSIFVANDDGVDELSGRSLNYLVTVDKTGINASEFDPKKTDFYTKAFPFSGKTAAKNADYFIKLISGDVTDEPTTNAIALNAGLALTCLGKASSIEEGATMAREVLLSGQVLSFVETYRRFAKVLSDA